ncbi:MAG: hypothetical protein QOE70_2713 [Chthoniobacter sp.]|jgi:hypothetical protein|nr:hypothetical protein [Chthoniobacter sp.]
MKNLLFSTLAILACTLGTSRTALAVENYFVFKVSMTLPLTYVILDFKPGVDKVVTKTLSGNDLVNLSRGRPLGSPVNKDTEMLVLGFTFTHDGLDAEQRPITPPLVKLMIYDTTATGAARKVQDLATITTLDYQEAFSSSDTNKGQGICAGKLLKTPAGVPGDSSKNKINEDADFHGAASVSQPGSGTGGPVDSFALTATSVLMRLKITLTDDNGTAPIDGYVLKGTFKTTGKRIDTYQE